MNSIVFRSRCLLKSVFSRQRVLHRTSKRRCRCPMRAGWFKVYSPGFRAASMAKNHHYLILSLFVTSALLPNPPARLTAGKGTVITTYPVALLHYPDSSDPVPALLTSSPGRYIFCTTKATRAYKNSSAGIEQRRVYPKAEIIMQPCHSIRHSARTCSHPPAAAADHQPLARAAGRGARRRLIPLSAKSRGSTRHEACLSLSSRAAGCLQSRRCWSG